MKDTIAGTLGFLFFISYALSAPVGIGFAIARDSWPDALLSLIIPMYGIIYAFFGG